MGKLKEFHFSIGDSTNGSIGYCARIQAKTKVEAVELLKKVIPSEFKLNPSSDKETENQAVIYIQVYINPDKITARDIDEVNGL